ncbi:MAG TPA: hypothetical protein VF006_09620 [Longimicrobium sp.]
MPTLKVTYIVPNCDVTKIAVEDFPSGNNRRELNLTDGKGDMELSPGTYALSWQAQGAAPDSEYTIEITAPPEVVFKPNPRKRCTPEGDIVAQQVFTIPS